MALGWAVMLALLGLLPGTMKPTAQQPVPERMGEVVLQSERLQRGVEQAVVLGQSV